MESSKESKLPSEVWGGPPAEIELGPFLALKDGNNFTDFTNNRVANLVRKSKKLHPAMKVGGPSGIDPMAANFGGRVQWVS